MAPPMSMPLPLAVMPPACDSPDWWKFVNDSFLTFDLEGNTHRYKEENTCHHWCESRPAHFSGVYIAQKSNCKSTDGRNDIGPVEDVVICNLVRCIRTARYNDHNHQLLASERLQVWKRREEREKRHNDESRPKRKWLEIPGKTLRTIASVHNIQLSWWNRVGKRPGSVERNGRSIHSTILGVPGTSEHNVVA